MRTNVALAVAAILGFVGRPEPLAAQDETPLANWEAPAEWTGAAAFRSLPTSPLTFVAVLPCRMADTRDGTLPPGYGPPALTAGAVRNFLLTGRCGIPSEAQAVSANVTVVNPPGVGFLLIRPSDGANVLVSTLNFIPNQTTANGAVIPLGTDGAASFLAGVTSTELVIDVNGYYAENPVSNSGVTAVFAGTGLTGGGTGGNVTLAVDPTLVQSRVSGTCAAGASIRTIGQTGTVTCEADDAGVTSVASGAGLTGGPITSTGTLSVSFAGAGSASTAARSDHDHVGQSWSGAGAGLSVSSTNSIALRGATANSNSYAILGEATAVSGVSTAIEGIANSPDGRGVVGVGGATSGNSIGVYGTSSSPSGYAGWFTGRVFVGGDLSINGDLAGYATATVAATGDGVSQSTQLTLKRFCAVTRMNQVGTVNPGTNFSCAISRSGSTFTLTARASSASHTVTCDMVCF